MPTCFLRSRVCFSALPFRLNKCFLFLKAKNAQLYFLHFSRLAAASCQLAAASDTKSYWLRPVVQIPFNFALFHLFLSFLVSWFLLSFKTWLHLPTKEEPIMNYQLSILNWITNSIGYNKNFFDFCLILWYAQFSSTPFIPMHILTQKLLRRDRKCAGMLSISKD